MMSRLMRAAATSIFWYRRLKVGFSTGGKKGAGEEILKGKKIKCNPVVAHPHTAPAPPSFSLTAPVTDDARRVANLAHRLAEANNRPHNRALLNAVDGKRGGKWKERR